MPTNPDLRTQIEALRERVADWRVAGRDGFQQWVVAEIDALLYAPTSEGWQPIETAPKDGTDVLVSAATPSGDRFVSEASFDGRLHWRIEERWDEIVYPTHWMPLPAPPRPTED